MLERLARWCYSRRRWVLVLWVFGFVAMMVIASLAKGPYSTDFNVPGSESLAAQQLLRARFPSHSGDTISVIFKADAGVNAPGVPDRVNRLLAQLSRNPHVVGSISPYQPAGSQNISSSGHVAFGVLLIDVQGADFSPKIAKAMIGVAKEASGNGVGFELGGQAIRQAEFVSGNSSEGIGILAAVVILLISFGSVLAMGLPILSALMGIGIGLAILELLARVAQVPNFSPLIAAMVGIGVGIDYALFIVTRYRQGLHDGLDPEQATVMAVTTAGRSVLFAGTTVVISVLGLLLMNLPFMQGVAFGSAAAVLVTMLASITLLPAMLGFAGRSIDRLSLPFLSRGKKDHTTGFWYRWSRYIQRRPGPAAIAAGIVVILLALPLFSMRLGVPDESVEPTSHSSRRAYDLLTEGFGRGYSSPLVLAVALSGSDSSSVVQRLESQLRSDPAVASVAPIQLNAQNDAAVITVYPAQGGADQRTVDLVSRLRDKTIPAVTSASQVKVFIGGPNAGFIDGSAAIASRLPLFIAVVVGFSFILLMAVFRSVLVALKAAVMNLLSIGAAYGVLVAVAQWGWMKGVFGIANTGPITNFVPMMMFAILFGLSMDYEVFLLSRIREEYERVGDNGLAVADGLAATARVITAAAAIMIMVFLSFVIGPELVIKQIGLGLAVAIFVDATLIRMILVPATMELLGRANWWLPSWLDRILPSVSFHTPRVPDVAVEGVSGLDPGEAVPAGARV